MASGMFRRSLLKHGAIASSGLAFGTGLMGLRQSGDDGDDEEPADGGGNGDFGPSEETNNEQSPEQSQDQQPSGGEVVDVIVQDNSFEPLVVEAQAGDTIRWTHQGNVSHTVTGYQSNNNRQRRAPAGANTIESGNLASGDSYEITLNTPGVYDYYCKPHEQSGMVGSIVVRGQGDDDPNQAGLSDPNNGPVGDAANVLQQANARARQLLGLNNGNQNQGAAQASVDLGIQSGTGDTLTLERVDLQNSQGAFITVQDQEIAERQIEASTPQNIRIGESEFLEGGEQHTVVEVPIGNGVRTPQEGHVLEPQEDSLAESGPLTIFSNKNNSGTGGVEVTDLPYSANLFDMNDLEMVDGFANQATAFHVQGDPMEACVLNRDVVSDGSVVVNDFIYAVDTWQNSNHDCERRLAGVLLGSIAGMDPQPQEAGRFTEWSQKLFGEQAPAGPIEGGAGGDSYQESELMWSIPHQQNTAFGSDFDNDDGAFGKGNKDAEEFPVVNYTYALLKEGDSVQRQQDVLQAKDMVRRAFRNKENMLRSDVAEGVFLESEEIQQAEQNLQQNGKINEPLHQGLRLSDVFDSLTAANSVAGRQSDNNNNNGNNNDI